MAASLKRHLVRGYCRYARTEAVDLGQGGIVMRPDLACGGMIFVMCRMRIGDKDNWVAQRGCTARGRVNAELRGIAADHQLVGFPLGQ